MHNHRAFLMRSQPPIEEGKEEEEEEEEEEKSKKNEMGKKVMSEQHL